ncbi:MAG TPA: radical SAM protein [Candidatus Gastranaerophilales bacterium]|nr:radical SAM protein [Candidatus Gastranaerophilales bacterium]
MTKLLNEEKKNSNYQEQNLFCLKESRNKMSLDRLKYFGHLLGGIKEVLHSRFIAKRPRPFTFSHLVTSKCNCNCDFCFWKHHRDNEDLSLDEIKRIYKEASKEGYMNSILWGGEPLLRQDFTEIAKASHDVGMYTKMATNGWFLEENHEFGNYMDLIFVSIDAIGSKHDELRKLPGLFDKCVSGIEFHKKRYPKMRIYVCCTVSAANDFDSIKEVAKLCKDLDILLYFTVNKSYHSFEEWENKNGFKKLELENDNLADIFKKIKILKKQGYPIRNSDYFMDYIINKKTFYHCHWPQVATVMYSNGYLLRCSDRKPIISVKDRPLKEVLRSEEFINMVNICKDCKLACVGNYALDASGLWRFEPAAIKSLAQIAIT